MRHIIGFILIVILLILTISCQTTYVVSDNDDLYPSKRNRDSVIVKYRYRDRYIYTPTPTPFYNPYNWWGQSVPMWNYPYRYNRPNTIIVIPKSEPEFKYGKRPDREGNGGVAVPLNRRRGRN